MKKHWKRITGAVLCAALIISACLVFGGGTALAYTSLPYIEELVASKTGSNSFSILEIVPANASGSIGYYVEGAEPFANQQAALAPLSNMAARSAYAAELMNSLASRGLISGGSATPLSYSDKSYVEYSDKSYVERKPWEMAPADYASMRRLSLNTREEATVTGQFSAQTGGGYRELVQYTGSDGTGDRVQIIDYFVFASSETTDGYYFYAPTFSHIDSGTTDIANGTAIYTNTATDGINEDPELAKQELADDALPVPDGYVYYDTWGSSIELDSDVNYYKVDSVSTPLTYDNYDKLSAAEKPNYYAAISDDYRLAVEGETGYFKFEAYEYVGVGSGNYACSASESGTQFKVYYSTVYYNLGFANNNWFLRYVFDRDDSYFSGSSRVSLDVVSMRADLVTATMVQNADLIVLSAGFSLSGGNLASSYTEGVDLSTAAAAAISSAVSNSVPVIVDYALTSISDTNIKTLAQTLCSGSVDSDNNFVSGNVYCFTGALASSGFNTAIANTGGFEPVSDELENENFLRVQADKNTKDKLPVLISPATAIRYIINSQKSRTVETKDTINVLEIQPGNVSTETKLTATTVKGWLGNPDELKTVNIVTMPVQEFIGKIDDLVENYDMIYIGDSTDGFNVGSDGNTVYNDSDMNGLIYSNIGDEYRSNMALAGLLDSDFIDTNKTILDGTSGTTANLFRFSGNDLTKSKADELISFANAGYPIICASSLVETADSKVVSRDFSVNLKDGGIDNGKAYFTAEVTCADGIPSSASLTYKLYSVSGSKLLETINVAADKTTFAYGATEAGEYYCTATIVDSNATGSNTMAVSNKVEVKASSTTPTSHGTSGIYYNVFAEIYNAYDGNLAARLSDTNRQTLASGISNIRFQWYSSDNNRDFRKNGTQQNQSYNRSTYYKCEITFTYNGTSYTLTSGTIYVNKDGRPRTMSTDYSIQSLFRQSTCVAAITAVVNGNTVNFSSSISGSPYIDEYQWQSYGGTYHDSAAFIDIGYANSALYSTLVPQSNYCYRLKLDIYNYDTASWEVLYSNVIQIQPSSSGNNLTTTVLGGGSGGSFPTKVSVTASVNTTHVDIASYMYYLLDTVKQYDNVQSVNNTEAMSSTLLRYVNLSKPEIVWTDAKADSADTSYSYPTEYKLNTDGTMDGISASDGSYYLSYSFKIENKTDPTPGATSYDCKLFLDQNSDGLYSSNEELTDIVIRNATTNALITPVKDGSDSYYALKADVNYTLTRQMPDDYAGIIPWKLSVIKNGTSSYIHASETNYTHITPTHEQVTTLKILQICSNDTSKINLEDQLKEYLGKDGKTYYSGIYGKLIADIDDFDIAITSKTILAVSNFGDEDAIFNELKKYNMLIIGFDDMYGTLSNDTANAIMRYINSDDTSVLFTHDTTSLTNLDPDNNTSVKTSSNTVVTTFFEAEDWSGKSKLTYDRYSGNLTWSGSGGSNLTFNGSNIQLPNGNYTITATVSNYSDNPFQIGVDVNQSGGIAAKAVQYVYKGSNQSVTVNFTVTDASKSSNLFFWADDNVSSAVISNYTVKSSNLTSLSSYGGPAAWGYSFNSILRDAVSLDRYGVTSDSTSGPGYSVAYKPGTNETSDRIQGYNNYSLIFWGNQADQFEPTTNDYSGTRTTYISQVNKGQITTYPYDINTLEFGGTDTTIGASQYMSIGQTHEQYYQLNLNSDDIVVWYCLSGGTANTSYFNDIPNDVLNSYYIYSLGNVTYSGVGHTAEQSNYTVYDEEAGKSIEIEERYINEAKLFVNTMIAAYRTKPSTPTVNFTSSSSGAEDLNYYFVTSDYTASGNTLSTTGSILEGNYKLYFRLTDPSLAAEKTIYLRFYYSTVKNGIESEKTLFDPKVFNADTNVQTTTFSGGLVYYIVLTDSILSELESNDSIKVYAEVRTNVTTGTTQDYIEVRRIGLFSLK